MPVKIQTSQDFDYELIPEGVYEATITRIVEKEEFNRFQNAQEQGFQIEFTITSEGEMKDKKAFRFFTPYLTKNSKLTALCKAVMGRAFTPEEMASIEGIEQLQGFIGGKPLMIVVKNRTSAAGNRYYTVADFLNKPGAGAAQQPAAATPAAEQPTTPPAAPAQTESPPAQQTAATDESKKKIST